MTKKLFLSLFCLLGGSGILNASGGISYSPPSGGGAGTITEIKAGNLAEVTNGGGPSVTVGVNSTGTAFVSYISTYGRKFEELQLATSALIASTPSFATAYVFNGSSVMVLPDSTVFYPVTSTNTIASQFQSASTANPFLGVRVSSAGDYAIYVQLSVVPSTGATYLFAITTGATNTEFRASAKNNTGTAGIITVPISGNANLTAGTTVGISVNASVNQSTMGILSAQVRVYGMKALNVSQSGGGGGSNPETGFNLYVSTYLTASPAFTGTPTFTGVDITSQVAKSPIWTPITLGAPIEEWNNSTGPQLNHRIKTIGLNESHITRMMTGVLGYDTSSYFAERIRNGGSVPNIEWISYVPGLGTATFVTFARAGDHQPSQATTTFGAKVVFGSDTVRVGGANDLKFGATAYVSGFMYYDAERSGLVITAIPPGSGGGSNPETGFNLWVTTGGVWVSTGMRKFEEIALATASISVGAADSLGTHRATQTVDMKGFAVAGATSVSVTGGAAVIITTNSRVGFTVAGTTDSLTVGASSNSMTVPLYMGGQSVFGSTSINLSGSNDPTFTSGKSVLTLVSGFGGSSGTFQINPATMTYDGGLVQVNFTSSPIIPDNGNGATVDVATMTPTARYVYATCSDANGCEYVLGVAAPISHSPVTVQNLGTNTIIFNDDAGVQKIGGNFTLGQTDSLTVHYDGTNWIEDGRSNN